jgi:HTH-type transcriptional regulator/antitoxin HigA
VDDCKNLPDYETLTLGIHHTPKLDFGNLQKRSCFIRYEAHYTELLTFVEECFERFGYTDQHSVFALVDLVATRIREYEDRVHLLPDTSTQASRLAFLMVQHGLRQCDLPEVGAQSVVSDVLKGKRALNLRQVQALAQRFSVPMDVLVA